MIHSPILLVLLLLLCCNLHAYSLASVPSTPPNILRGLLNKKDSKGNKICHMMPCIYDGLTARLVASSKMNFNVTFMTGFGTAAVKGFSDSGVVDGREMMDSAGIIAVSYLIIKPVYFSDITQKLSSLSLPINTNTPYSHLFFSINPSIGIITRSRFKKKD